MTSADLGDYSVRRRTPLRLTYREYEVIAMPPPSSGGICLAQILNILEHFDLRDMRRKNSATAASMTIEAMKHAFADRARYLGDADFVDVPFERLMSKEYAKSLADKIKSPLPLGRYGTPTAGRSMEQIPADGGTSHFCIVDRLGNCVVSTETINTEFGSLAAIDEWGLILNNEMDDFTARPGEANAFGLIQSANNSIAPGKRPLSSMSPTMVLRNDQPVLLLGGSGGPRIISSVLQVMLNVVDYGDSLGEAVAARRFHHQWQPDCIFFDGEPDADLVRQLESMGYRVNDERREGVVQAIQIDGGRLTGASDPRKGGRPAGE
jgi:gamma-glutamyltranspeptidase/glutathione hydrolase